MQQWLHERVSMLRYTFIVCLVYAVDNIYVLFIADSFVPSYLIFCSEVKKT
jgi:hypothetical protein